MLSKAQGMMIHGSQSVLVKHCNFCSYGYDPLGLGKDGGQVETYRAYELLHARWAMLAAAGIILPEGLQVTTKGKPVEPGSDEDKDLAPHLIGTGKFTECLSKTFPLLDKDAPCPDAPCLLHGVHVPAIDFDVNHFVGVSEYWHTTHEIFEMGHKDKAYDFKTYQERVNEFCSKPWEEIEAGISKHQWGKKVDETTALEVCFKASWLINVLHDGIGVPRTGLEEMTPGINGTKAVLDKTKEKGKNKVPKKGI